MLKKIYTTKLGIVMITVFAVVCSYGLVALADVIINGGNNVVYESRQVESNSIDSFGGNLDATGGICTGLGDPVTTMCNVDINYLDVTSAAIFGENATTSIARLDSTIDVDLSWTPTTTATINRNVLARYENVGNDLICYPPIMDITIAAGAFGGNYSVGTTTLSDGQYLHNTSSASLIGLTAINTTTDGLLTPQIGTSVDGLFITAGALGSYYSQIAGSGFQYATGTQPFILKSGELLVVYTDYSGASSTESWTANGPNTFTGVGKLHAECRNRF